MVGSTYKYTDGGPVVSDTDGGRIAKRPGIDVWRPVSRAGSLLSRNLLTTPWIFLGQFFGALSCPFWQKFRQKSKTVVKTPFRHR